RPSRPLCPFFFPCPACTEIYALSLHDALPICAVGVVAMPLAVAPGQGVDRAHRAGARGEGGGQGIGLFLQRHGHVAAAPAAGGEDRKSTRLNSSHVKISYAVFCLKKKKRTPAR